MRKRPLCTAAVAVLILLAAVNIWFESAISNPCTLRRIIPDASQVTVTGQVKRWEEKPDYRMFYLRDCQVLQKENNTNSDRQSVNKQFEEQVKAKVIQEPELLIYIEQDQKETQTIKLGNQIQIQGELSYFEEARNPGNFDQKIYYEKQGLHASIWAKNCRITDQETWKFREWLAKLRRNWKRLLVSQMGARHGNSMSAILLGEKSELDAQMKALYQKSGIGHILAISGVKTLKLDIPLVPETRINWAFVPLHIAIIYILKLCLDEEIIPRCRFPCSRGYLTKCINWQKK